MQKLPILIAALLAFSVLAATASAQIPEQSYAIRFHGSARRPCMLETPWYSRPCTGGIRVSGVAIGVESESYYSDTMLKLRGNIWVNWDEGHFVIRLLPRGDIVVHYQPGGIRLLLQYSGHYRIGDCIIPISGRAFIILEHSEAWVSIGVDDDDPLVDPLFYVEWERGRTHITVWPIGYFT